MIQYEDLVGMGYYDRESTSVPKSHSELVADFIRVSQQVPSSNLYLKLIQEEFLEWCEAETPVEEMKELVDLLYVVYGYAQAKGWDIDAAFRRVHENNMGRMFQPDGTIHRRPDGKIIKNPDYPKVNLTDLAK